MTLEVKNLEEALESKIFSVAYSIRDLSDMPVETRSPIKKAEHENESSTHQENNVEENFPQRHNTIIGTWKKIFFFPHVGISMKGLFIMCDFPRT